MVVLKMSTFINPHNPMLLPDYNIPIHNMLQNWKIYCNEFIFLKRIIHVQDTYILHSFEATFELEHDLHS